MKFRKVSFIDHPIFGSVSFDFTDASGKTLDTIILAGENGCGKSLLLSFLNTYSPIVSAKELGFKLKVEVEFSNDEIETLKNNKNFNNIAGKRIKGHIVTFNHDTSFRDDSPRAHFNEDLDTGDLYSSYFSFVYGLFKTVFSDVEINFSPSEIRHTSSNNLDIDLSESVRSSHNLATEIKQLLIDINELDSEELSKWVDGHKGEVPPEDVIHKRMRRFTDAFNKMFPHKHFVGIDNQNGQKKVLFQEYGREMEIDQLSSGEKQIVFRGGFLLRNLGTITGAPILVDEPELSLHPQWQLKIVNFLKSLFIDDLGQQTSQLIVATHSPFIIHNDMRANDKVIVLKKNDKGDVVILDKPEFYNWTESLTVEEAFNVTPLNADNKILVFLEGPTDELYFNKAMDVYGFDKSLLSFNWIGRYVGGDYGRAENTGDRALNSAASFIKANPWIIKHKKVYLLYDCDTNKPDEQDGDLFISAMNKNTNAKKYLVGVENLLVLPEDFEYSKYYKRYNRTDNYGAESTYVDLDKTLLASDIVNMPNNLLLSVLVNVKEEINKILVRTKEK
jgi:predicted ATPase